MTAFRLCQYPDCSGIHYDLGWCQKHYSRFRRYGDPAIVHPRRRNYEAIASRLARRSVRIGACLVYTGGRPSRSGHRTIGYEGRYVGVHRVAFELANGPIPPGKCVMHWCDNPPCIEPHHLRLGTVADNNLDRDAKGRHRALPGSRNGNASLQEWQVAEIKARLASGESTYQLAAAYRCSQSSVWLIKSGRAWRHVHLSQTTLPAGERSDPAGGRGTQPEIIP